MDRRNAVCAKTRMTDEWKSHCYLYAKVSSVDVIAKEEILGVGRRSAHFKQFHQIVKLPVDVAANCWFPSPIRFDESIPIQREEIKEKETRKFNKEFFFSYRRHGSTASGLTSRKIDGLVPLLQPIQTLDGSDHYTSVTRKAPPTSIVQALAFCAQPVIDKVHTHTDCTQRQSSALSSCAVSFWYPSPSFSLSLSIYNVYRVFVTRNHKREGDNNNNKKNETQQEMGKGRKEKWKKRTKTLLASYGFRIKRDTCGMETCWSGPSGPSGSRCANRVEF